MTRELAKLRHGRSTRQHRERGAGPVCNAARGNCKLGHSRTAVRERPTLVKERNRRIREYNSTREFETVDALVAEIYADIVEDFEMGLEYFEE